MNQLNESRCSNTTVRSAKTAKSNKTNKSAKTNKSLMTNKHKLSVGELNKQIAVNTDLLANMKESIQRVIKKNDSKLMKVANNGATSAEPAQADDKKSDIPRDPFFMKLCLMNARVELFQRNFCKDRQKKFFSTVDVLRSLRKPPKAQQQSQ